MAAIDVNFDDYLDPDHQQCSTGWPPHLDLLLIPHDQTEETHYLSHNHGNQSHSHGNATCVTSDQRSCKQGSEEVSQSPLDRTEGSSDYLPMQHAQCNAALTLTEPDQNSSDSSNSPNIDSVQVLDSPTTTSVSSNIGGKMNEIESVNALDNPLKESTIETGSCVQMNENSNKHESELDETSSVGESIKPDKQETVNVERNNVSQAEKKQSDRRGQSTDKSQRVSNGEFRDSKAKKTVSTNKSISEQTTRNSRTKTAGAEDQNTQMSSKTDFSRKTDKGEQEAVSSLRKLDNIPKQSGTSSLSRKLQSMLPKADSKSKSNDDVISNKNVLSTLANKADFGSTITNKNVTALQRNRTVSKTTERASIQSESSALASGKRTNPVVSEDSSSASKKNVAGSRLLNDRRRESSVTKEARSNQRPSTLGADSSNTSRQPPTPKTGKYVY